MNKTFEKLGFYPADILLPKDQDMTKWAVVACDQFTSEPEYWQAVEEKVGKAPSTLRLILPGVTDTIQVSAEAAIAESIIVGDVPEVYTNVANEEDMLNLIPSDKP